MSQQIIPTKTTRRKFYGKWLYKVTLTLPGATALRVYNRAEIDKVLNGTVKPHQHGYSTFRSNLWKNKDTVRSMLDLLDQYQDNEWGHRVEHDWIDLYTNNKNLYNDMSDKFATIAVHRFEPDEKNLDKLEGKSMLVKKLPHDRFGYRVYLLPHNLLDFESKERFLSWLESLKPKVTLSDSVTRWFKATKTNWDRRYILVEDEGTLLMMKLRNPDVIGTVYKFELE